MVRHRSRRDRRSVGRGLSILFARAILFDIGRRRPGGRLDQRDQADIGADADPLQHHLADADRRLGAAFHQRIAAGLVEAGIAEIAEAEQGAGGFAGADEQAVGRERRHRHPGALDETMQAFDQRHGAQRRIHRGDEHAGASIGEVEAGAGAGHQHAQAGAEPVQPFEPDRAVRRQPAREPGDLAAMAVRRAEGPVRERCAMGRAEQPCADRIGPEHARAVDRPEPGGQRRGRVHGQPGIAHASQLEIRTRHPTGFKSRLSTSGCKAAGMTALRKG